MASHRKVVSATADHYNIEITTVGGKLIELAVDRYGYDAWLKGTLIQYALPNLTSEERELLKTGMTDEDWENVKWRS